MLVVRPSLQALKLFSTGCVLLFPYPKAADGQVATKLICEIGLDGNQSFVNEYRKRLILIQRVVSAESKNRLKFVTGGNCMGIGSISFFPSSTAKADKMIFKANYFHGESAIFPKPTVLLWRKDGEPTKYQNDRDFIAIKAIAFRRLSQNEIQNLKNGYCGGLKYDPNDDAVKLGYAAMNCPKPN